jgi:tetratricopeptide (TPR) repeat protein
MMKRSLLLAGFLFLSWTNTQSASAASFLSSPHPTQSPPTRKEKVANPLNELLDEAKRDIDAKDFNAAIGPLNKFIAQQPDVAYGHFELAYVYTALQKPTEARAEYEKAIALDPKMAESYLNLGVLFIERDSTVAIPNLQKAVELLPSQSRPRYLLGVAEEHGGDISAATKSFEGAYTLDPSNPEPILHLANLYLRLHRPAEAEAKFRAMLEKQPDNAQAILGVAASLDAQKKPEAADAYRAYLSKQPGDSEARARLIHLLVEQQQFDTALAELDRADAGNAGNPETWRLRADIEIGQKKWDDAISTLSKAIAQTPNEPELHGGVGRIYIEKRDFPSALKELKIAISLDQKSGPKDPKKTLDYWKDLSTAFYLSGDYASTIAALDRVAQMEKPGAGAWFIRALCYDKLNQPQPALDAYQMFLSLDQGQNADQIWQAQERSKVLRKVLEHKK